MRCASDVHERPVGDLAAARDLDLRQRLVEQEIRRDHVLRGRGFQTSGFAVQLTGIRLEAREVRVRIRRRLDGVLLVQHARDFEERAGVLRDDVGRVAIRPARVEQRRIAVRESEPLGRELMRRAHDVHIDARCFAEARGVDGLQALQPLRDALRDRLSVRPPSGR